MVTDLNKAWERWKATHNRENYGRCDAFHAGAFWQASRDRSEIQWLKEEHVRQCDEIQYLRAALEQVLIKVDWNSDEFSDLKQYAETRGIILKALGAKEERCSDGR